MPLVHVYPLLIRLLLGYIFVSSGLCKLTNGQFGQLIGPPRLIQDLAPYGLADFAVFVATSQVLVGALVLSQRYSLLGLVALVPMHLSMLAVTISLRWQGTPYVDGVFLALNVVALLYEWPSLRFFLRPDTPAVARPPRVNRLFPNRALPIGGLLAVAGAAVAARHYVPLTVPLATTGFLVFYANVFTNRLLDPLDRAVLALSLLAILGVTLGNVVAGAPVARVLSPPMLVAGALALLLLLLLISAVRHYVRRHQPAFTT